MFCKNCGKPMNDNQAICLNCGVATGVGNNFCPNCGGAVNPGAAFCLNCGIALQAPAAPMGAAPVKGNLNGQDKMTMALVCFFLGGIGIHNFMMGEKNRGIKKILFSLLCGIGGILALIDFIQILTDSYIAQPDA